MFRTQRRLVAGGFACAVALATTPVLVVGCDSREEAPVSMHGQVVSRLPEPSQAAEGGRCLAMRRDRDIEVDDPVVVYGREGERELGSASLGAGEWHADRAKGNGTCVFRFVVTGLPIRDCYGVGVDLRPTIYVTLDEVRSGTVDVSSDLIRPAPCRPDL